MATTLWYQTLSENQLVSGIRWRGSSRSPRLSSATTTAWRMRSMLQGRRLTWHKDVGIAREADSTLASIVFRDAGGGGTTRIVTQKTIVSTEGVTRTVIAMPRRAATTVWCKQTEANEHQGSQKIDSEDTTKYRVLAAKTNFPAFGRGYVLFTAKEITRCMPAPSYDEWENRLRRGRYPRGRPREVTWHRFRSRKAYSRPIAIKIGRDVGERGGAQREASHPSARIFWRCGVAHMRSWP